jgi:hypothetical protein
MALWFGCKENMKMNKRLKTGRVRAVIADRDIDPPERSWTELITDPDLKAVVAFSLIGLLTALNLMFRFPDFGDLIAQNKQF